MTSIRIVAPSQNLRLSEIGELTALAYLADGLLDAAHPYVPQLRDAKTRAEKAILLMAAGGSNGEGAAQGTITVVPPESTFSEYDGPDFELRMLAVSPLERAKGIGEDLARFGLTLAVERGATRVLLSTMHAMTAAHRLYEKVGFVRIPELDWVAHPDSAKRQCDDSCRRPDGTCTADGQALMTYGWMPAS